MPLCAATEWRLSLSLVKGHKSLRVFVLQRTEQKRMQKKETQAACFFLSYISLEIWTFFFFSLIVCPMPALPPGPPVSQSGVWCLLGRAVITLLRQKPKTEKHPRGLSCHWWMEGMRERVVCVCVCGRVYCRKSWTDGSMLPEGATEQTQPTVIQRYLQ